MRKKVMSVVAGFFLLAVLAAPSWAQQVETYDDSDMTQLSRAGTYEESDITQRLGIGYRFGWMDEDDDNGVTIPDLDQKHSLLLIYGMSPYTAIQLEGAFASDWSFDTEFYSVFADLQLRLPMDELAAYIFGGVGFQNTDAGSLFSVDDSLAYRAGIGAEYFMTEQTAVNAEGIYNFDDGDDTFNNWEVRVGLSYYF